MWADSDGPGTGSTFSFTLASRRRRPRRRPRPDASAACRRTRRPAAARRRRQPDQPPCRSCCRPRRGTWRSSKRCRPRDALRQTRGRRGVRCGGRRHAHARPRRRRAGATHPRAIAPELPLVLSTSLGQSRARRRATPTSSPRISPSRCAVRNSSMRWSRCSLDRAESRRRRGVDQQPALDPAMSAPVSAADPARRGQRREPEARHCVCSSGWAIASTSRRTGSRPSNRSARQRVRRGADGHPDARARRSRSHAADHRVEWPDGRPADHHRHDRQRHGRRPRACASRPGWTTTCPSRSGWRSWRRRCVAAWTSRSEADRRSAAESIIDVATYRELEATAGAEFAAELVATFLEEAPTMLGDAPHGTRRVRSRHVPEGRPFDQVERRHVRRSLAFRPRPRTRARCAPEPERHSLDRLEAACAQATSRVADARRWLTVPAACSWSTTTR